MVGSQTPLGHQSALPPRCGESGPILDPEIRERLASIPSCDIADAVGRLYILDAAIHPLALGMPKLVGVAVTAKVPPADNWTIHAALSLIRPGDVLVVDWLGYHAGCGTGVSSTVPAIKRGLAGIVIDGGWRDVDELAALGIPVHGRARTAYSPPKAALGEVNVPVNCGGVVVCPGDVIVGDVDGTVCIPRWGLERVLAKVKPTRVRTALDEFGDDPLTGMVEVTPQRYWAEFAARGGIGKAAS
jgi:regulator of RNase E activity RraA